MGIIDVCLNWLMKGPPSFGRCPVCHNWFVFRLLGREQGKFGPTDIYLCSACGHEKRYDSLSPQSPHTLD